MNRSKPITATGRLNTAQRTWLEWLRWIAVEDHCEWANPHVAKLKTPLGVLLQGAIVALLCGIFVAPQGYAIFAAILVVVVLGLAWPWIAMRGVNGQLDFATRRGREGKQVVAEFVVVNRWPWPVWGLAVNNPLFAGEEGTESAVALARIEGWSRATFNCTLTPSQRGKYPRDEVSIGSGFPFGLYTVFRPIEVQKEIIVWPETFWLPPLADRSSRADWHGEVSERRVGTQGARLGPREHRPGDSLRDVHWAKSAQLGQLIVSEREAASVEEYTIVVDVDPERISSNGRSSTLEWSLRIAASICEAVVDNRGSATLWLGDRKVTARSPGDELQKLLDAIALLDPRAITEQEEPQRYPAASSAISIGVEDSPTQGGRFICLRGPNQSRRVATDAWIEIDPQEDVAGQVLRGWRTPARRPRRAK